jgi:hypothetical protein
MSLLHGVQGDKEVDIRASPRGGAPLDRMSFAYQRAFEATSSFSSASILFKRFSSGFGYKLNRMRRRDRLPSRQPSRSMS